MVVVQPGFLVLALERGADAGLSGGVGDDFPRLPPGLVVHFQRQRALFAGQRLRGALVVCVVGVHRRRFAGFRRGFARLV